MWILSVWQKGLVDVKTILKIHPQQKSSDFSLSKILSFKAQNNKRDVYRDKGCMKNFAYKKKRACIEDNLF